MASLLSFRKRMWSLLSPNNLETKQPTSSAIQQSHRGTKRKLSFSSESEIDFALKKLRLEETGIKQESTDEDYSMIEASLDDENLLAVIKAEYDGHAIAIRKPCKRSISPRRSSIVDEIHNIDSDEEFDNDEVQREKEELSEEWTIQTVDHVTADDEGFEGWSQQELDFFNRLNDRGVVPMFWLYWKIDFPTLPESLFTPDKGDALIINWKGNAASGAKAFNILIQAGGYARDRRQRGHNAAQLLAKEINSYIQWSWRDAKLDKDLYIPLIVVNFAHKNEDLETTDARTQSRVRELSEQYRKMWEEAEPKFKSPSPTIFHIFIARTVMGFGSYDTSAEQPEFKNIFFTDWKQRGHDLWNAMAIALLVQQTRSWLVKVDPRKKQWRKKSELDPDL